MEIKNVKVENVVVAFDDRDRLAASVAFKSNHNCCAWGFILTNSLDSQRLAKLMKYAGVSRFNDLNGKIVRVVIHESFLRGVGDPIDDKFFSVFGEEVQEFTEEQFEALLKNK